jgi:Na+-transporting NADH:ubiquinone oxidoreductase subunit NqrE
VLSLGTNDVAQYRNDTEQIIVNVTTCVENVKHKYPNASIGVCSILPGRGKGTHIQALNSVASSVNTFIKKLCLKNNKMRFIDTLSLISSVSFLYCVTSFVPRLNTTLSTFSLSTCESDLSNSF